MAAALASRSTAQKAGLAIGAGLTAGMGAYYITQVRPTLQMHPPRHANAVRT